MFGSPRQLGECWPSPVEAWHALVTGFDKLNQRVGHGSALAGADSPSAAQDAGRGTGMRTVNAVRPGRESSDAVPWWAATTAASNDQNLWMALGEVS